MTVHEKLINRLYTERRQLVEALQIVADAIEAKESRSYLREPDWNPEAHTEPITLQIKDARRIFDLLEGKYLASEPIITT